VVQTFTFGAAKRSGTLRGSCGENCIPNFRRSFAIDAELSEFELTFPDPMHEFNAAMVIEAHRKRFNPSIGPRRSLIDRWSCSIRLFK